MSTVNPSGKSLFKTHRPVDTADPGFTIPGKKLRWLSPRVSENNPSRPWVIIRKSNLPPELVKYIEDRNPGAFAHGDTIRRGDLVLALSSDEAAKAMRQDLDEVATERERSVSRATHGINDASGRSRAKVEINEDRDVSQEMIERFKNNPKD